MPAPAKGSRPGGSPAHQRHMLANLATALFEHGKITTTEARARRLRPVAERLITFAKRGDLHARRQVLTMVTDRNGVHTLFAETGSSLAARDGGYTPITRANSWCWSWGTGDTAGRVRRIAAPHPHHRNGKLLPDRGVSDPRLLNVADMMQKRLAGRRRRVTAGTWRRLSQGTSATRADRQHRPRAALGPSCRSSCPRRTPDCANRMSRPPGRRPGPPRGLWCGGPQRSAPPTGERPGRSASASRRRRPGPGRLPACPARRCPAPVPGQ